MGRNAPVFAEMYSVEQQGEERAQGREDKGREGAKESNRNSSTDVW
jgi:hypothetical protein